MQYTDHFYPPFKSYIENIENLKNNTDPTDLSSDEPPIEKRQKLEESDENKILKSAHEIGSPPKDKLDIDIIIDDDFLNKLKDEKHKTIFAKIIKMIETMENLN